MNRSLGLFGLLVAALVQAQATSITVKELSVDPAKIVNITVYGGNYGSGKSTFSGNAYAGVVNILADGTPMDAFCIDPFHFSSSSSLTYNIVDLQDAPKDGLIYDGPMGVIAADKISKLWAMAYSPTLSPLNAAALQLAIWEVVGGNYFQWNDPAPLVYDVYDEAQSLLDRLATYQGAGADLVALKSVDQRGQDYVVARVPDGGATAALLGLGLLGLSVVRRKLS
jgi:hypothetical protein